MFETIILRLKPKLEVILKEPDFEAIDTSSPKNEGIYAYNSVESVTLKKEHTNWLVSIASYIFGILTERGMGEKYKDKAYLIVTLKDRTLKLWLIKSDMKNAELLTK